jgi:hypothetical protein
MDLSINSLNASGYQNQPVPNTFTMHPNPADHLGVILPGYRYSADMPSLYYTRQVLLDQGADTLSVDYDYSRTDFMKMPQKVRDEWMSTDVLAACNAVFSQHRYKNVTLVGKSLGTIAMGHLLADHRFRHSACIWLTPMLTVDWLCSRIREIRPRSLFIIGTADQYYRPDILQQLENVTKGRSVVIKGVNHAMEIQGDIQGSIMALIQMSQSVQAFIQEGA